MPSMLLCDIFVGTSTKNILLIITLVWAAIMGGFMVYSHWQSNRRSDKNTKKFSEELEKRKLLSRVGIGGAIAIVMNADGRPTKAELEEAKRFLRAHYKKELQIEILHHIKRVLALKRPNTDYYLNLINTCFNYSKRKLIVDMLYEVASFNGGITPDEWQLLNHIMEVLHITDNDVDHFHQIYHNRIGSSRYTGTDAINTSENSLNKCYRTLGLKKGATVEEVKSAYRRLVKQYHPDRLANESDPEKITAYTKKFREINEAYEELIEVLG